MCCIPCTKRKENKKTADLHPETNRGEVRKTCNVAKVKEPEGPRGRLVRLEVSEAHGLDGDRYWNTAQAKHSIRVKAITDPDDAETWGELKWGGDGLVEDNEDPRTMILSRDAATHCRASAHLSSDPDNRKTADIWVAAPFFFPAPSRTYRF